MDYKTEMRKLIDIVKQQSSDAPLESTLDDLTTLSTAVKDLSDRIKTRTKQSQNPNVKDKSKQTKQKIIAKPFPSVKHLAAPQCKKAPSSSSEIQQLKNVDFNKQRDDFVVKKKALPTIKPQLAP